MTRYVPLGSKKTTGPVIKVNNQNKNIYLERKPLSTCLFSQVV